MNNIKDKIPFNVGMFEDEYNENLRVIASPKNFNVMKINNADANEFILHHHYLHRKIYIARNVSYGLYMGGQCIGVSMFGYPVWTSYPGLCPPHNVGECPELIRLCTMRDLPKNTESWFLARCIKNIKGGDWKNETGYEPKYITSFCDEAFGFDGAIYKATNFKLLRKTTGRPTNPGKPHGKWGENDYKQDAIKAFYIYRLD